MIQRIHLIFLVLLLSLANILYSFTVEMVKDLNTSGPSPSSWPQNIKSIGNIAYFSANDGVHGWELWITNGTNEGTFLLKDLNPGADSSSPGLFTPLGSYVYFITQTYTSNESSGQLWRTDGTPDGTQMIVGGFFAIFNMVRFQNNLFLLVMDENRLVRLWKSDGTSQGTVLFGGSTVEGSLLTPAGNFLYFIGHEETTGYELWRTDGTIQGTILLADIRKGKDSSYPTQVKSFGNLIIFIANDGTHGSELWRSDGTFEGTRLIKDIAEGSASSVYSYYDGPFGLRLGSFFYFPADDGIYGMELWKTNGTPEGTTLVADIRPGSAKSSPAIKAVFKGFLYFTATDNSHGHELWRTQGTSQTTTLFKDFIPGKDWRSLGDFQVTDRLYFESNDSLWTSNGTFNGTVRIPKVVRTQYCSPPCSYFPLHRLGNSVIFQSTGSGNLDVELWISGGTAATTHRIKDIWIGNAGSSPQTLAEIGGNLIFKAETSEYRYKLYRTNGTPSGTVPIISGDIGNTTAIDNILWFSIKRNDNWVLYRMDPSFEPQRLVSFNDYYSPGNFTKFNGAVYFASGNQLWKTDGSTSGTIKIFDLISGRNWFTISKLLSIGDKLFILAGSNGNALWITNGSTSGTKLLRYFPVKHVTNVPADPMIAIGPNVYFLGTSSKGAEQLWKSDGTKTGTVLVKTIGAPWPPASISNFVALNNIIYFAALKNDFVFWRSDGTTEGTFETTLPQSAGDIMSWNNSLYLTAYINSTPGQSYWSFFKSDGTAAGTIELQKISAGSFASSGSLLFFAGRNEEQGNELWVTDGTPQGTSLFKDIWSGQYSSNPSFLISTTTGIYFSANDGVHGDELFRLTP